MKQRTRARGIALQALYEIDLVDHKPLIVLDHLLQRYAIEEKYSPFVNEIVKGVFPLREKLDVFIAAHAPEWPLDQVAAIDRNIIRIALWEIVFYGDTPIKVAINEAVELAKLFGSDSAPRFVNGVLGALVDHLNEIKIELLHLSTE